MEHRWGMGSRVGRRAVMGAAAAMALVALQTGAALADAPAPSAPTPVGTVATGEIPDDLGSGLVGPDPTAGLPLLGVSLDTYDVMPQASPPETGAAQPLAASGSRQERPLAPSTRRGAPGAIDRDVVVLTACAFTATGCASADPARLIWDLLPFIVGAPGGLPAPGQPCPAAATCSPAGQPVGDPAAVQPPPVAGQLVGGAAPALDAVGLALGTPARPGAPVPAGAAAAASASAPSASAPPALASTGAPIVAALAGLVLLMVGGCLTWARART
jgi:hypothetical protein